MPTLKICKECEGVPAPPTSFHRCKPCGNHGLAWAQKAYIQWLHELDCCWCGGTGSFKNPMVTHHEWVYGGKAASLRDPDHLGLPLCTTCHLRRHAVGRDTFWGGDEVGHMLRGLTWLLQACFELDVQPWFEARALEDGVCHSPTWVVIGDHRIGPEFLVLTMECEDRETAVEMVKELIGAGI